ADAPDRRTDGLAGERSGSSVGARSVRQGAAEIGLGGRPQFADRYSLGEPRRSGVDASIREGTRRVTARPHSFAQHPRPPPHCCKKLAPSPSFLGLLLIRSAAASSRASRAQAPTLPVLPLRSRRRQASGWNCSRRLRPRSPGSPPCSTLQWRHSSNFGSSRSKLLLRLSEWRE